MSFLGCNNWQVVDAYLLQIGKNTIALNRHETEMNDEINAIKAKFNDQSKGLKEENNKLETAIKAFVNNLKKKKITNKLSFGIISIQSVEKVSIRSNEACVNSLKQLGLNEYISINEMPNKDKIKKLETKLLAKIGASYKRENTVVIEPALEKCT